MIDVTLLNLVAVRAGRSSCSVEPTPGLAVLDVIRELGVEEKTVQITLVNGKIARLDTVLEDGDRVILSALVAGG